MPSIVHNFVDFSKMATSSFFKMVRPLAKLLCCRCVSTITGRPKVLVTGGAKGIGLGIVQSFLEENAQVTTA